MLIILDVKINNMIKAIKCKWNWLLNMLMFDTENCPYQTCTCKK